MNRPLRIMHLTASPFFGGPERVILDIARTQAAPPYGFASMIVSFGENGGCAPFLDRVAAAGLEGIRLHCDMPHLWGAIREVTTLLRKTDCDILCAHGHKARFVGRAACGRLGIPIVGVSHGWTWQDWKTSLYERLDQWMHRRMDAVVCVSEGQAAKVRLAGTPSYRITVIHNAIDIARFDGPPQPFYREKLEAFLSRRPGCLVGAAGRLSPEKGYDVLIAAVACCREDVGVVLFGEGVLRERLQQQINAHALEGRFILAGFTPELDRFLPHFDLFAQSSHTEGFPCVNLEAMAAGLPVVATEVGGVPEQIDSECQGLLVPPNDPKALAAALDRLAADPDLRQRMGTRARERVMERFTCAAQAKEYAALFDRLLESRGK